MAFNNYLIKLGGSSGTILPLGYLQYDTYDSTPSQMLDLDSTRNTLGELKRNVLSHTATKIEVKTNIMDGAKHDNLMNILRSNMSDLASHTITLEYWDDFSCSYKTGVFYVPDIKFRIININEQTGERMYGSASLTFIEY